MIAENGHIDIDQVSQNFKKSEINIQIATLYRILGELSSVGILHTVALSVGKKIRNCKNKQYEKGKSVACLSKFFHVARNTIYRALKNVAQKK